MKVVIFAGPSLPPSARPLVEGFSWRAPARQGDLYRAALERPVAIGLVDGYFETVPSVWHKEILWALSHRILVFGSSSVGALRAVELRAFGMRGVGKVFEDFRDGKLQDDDEVAVLHAPEELDFAPLTEPMVNMRATAASALRKRLIAVGLTDVLLRAAKDLFYKDRTWEAAAALSKIRLKHRCTEIDRAREILTRNRVDRKRDDAMALLYKIADAARDPHRPSSANFSLARTAAWARASRAITRPTELQQ